MSHDTIERSVIMASHFSSLGIPMRDRDSFFDYFKKSYESGKHINTDKGMYTRWENS